VDTASNFLGSILMCKHSGEQLRLLTKMARVCLSAAVVHTVALHVRGQSKVSHTVLYQLLLTLDGTTS